MTNPLFSWVALCGLLAACTTKEVVQQESGGAETGAGGGVDGSDCFVAGTLVATPGGDRPIEELRPGDSVWSWDLEAAQPVERQVLRRLRRTAPVVLVVEAGAMRIDGVSPEHPFWSPTKADWVEAGALRPGDSLLTPEGRAEVSRVVRESGQREVFNLTVEGPEHTYFAEGVLVHNKTPNDGVVEGVLDTAELDGTAIDSYDIWGDVLPCANCDLLFSGAFTGAGTSFAREVEFVDGLVYARDGGTTDYWGYGTLDLTERNGRPQGYFYIDSTGTAAAYSYYGYGYVR